MAEKIPMLALSPTMEKGLIAHWSKKEGERVNSGDVLCEVETDKATMEYESFFDGVLLKILVKEGESAIVGEMIAISGEQGEDIAALIAEKPSIASKKTEGKQKSAQKTVVTAEGTGEQKRVKASPLARNMAMQLGINLTTVLGSGPGGRIVKRDIEKLATPTVPLQPSLAGKSTPVSQKRKIIAQRLVESKFSAPHYYLKLTVNARAILEARKQLNAKREQKVSMNAFFIKFCAKAIAKHPIINSTWKKDAILQFPSIDIGLAVARPDGLITPVVRNCAKKGILQIDEELKRLIDKAFANKLAPEDFLNATFTISNLGSFGIEEFTAIINPPGSAILALGKVSRQAAVVGEDIAIVPQMKMTLSCDHRVIDGAVGAAFFKDIKDMMENPILALY